MRFGHKLKFACDVSCVICVMCDKFCVMCFLCCVMCYAFRTMCHVQVTPQSCSSTLFSLGISLLLNALCKAKMGSNSNLHPAILT